MLAGYGLVCVPMWCCMIVVIYQHFRRTSCIYHEVRWNTCLDRSSSFFWNVLHTSTRLHDRRLERHTASYSLHCKRHTSYVILESDKQSFILSWKETWICVTSLSKECTNNSWFQTFAVFCMLYVFFWVIPQRLNFKRRRFGTLCSIFIGR